MRDSSSCESNAEVFASLRVVFMNSKERPDYMVDLELITISIICAMQQMGDVSLGILVF